MDRIAGGDIIDVEDSGDALPSQPAGKAHPEAGDAKCEIVQSGEFILERIVKVKPGKTILGDFHRCFAATPLR